MTLYAVDGIDNDEYAFEDNPAVRRCSTCNNIVDKWTTDLSTLRMSRRKLDLSTTYDGLCIGSQRLLEVIQKNGIRGLKWNALPGDSEFSAVWSDQIVRYDVEKSNTVFEGKCVQCGQWQEASGAEPIMLVSGDSIETRSFAQTDIEFGSGDEKCPVLLCDEETATILDAAGLNGLDLVLQE